MSTYTSDLWQHLKAYTAARIALGRTGNSIPTRQLLEFQLAHAQAKDAVHKALAVEEVTDQLASYNLPVLTLHSQAHTRSLYLQRPDMGRKLNDASVRQLTGLPQTSYDICFVVADGLSAIAIENNCKLLLDELMPLLQKESFSLAPLCLVQQARVAIGDQIASLLRSRMVVIFIGERPGLSSPDSLGIYLTYQPHVGLTDEKRNCISNVRAGGLPHVMAARKLLHLIKASFARQLSGVQLKDDMDIRLIP